MGGPGGGDRTLALKSRKNRQKSTFVRKNLNTKKYLFFLIFLLVKPKYVEGKNVSLGSFWVGQNQKT